MSTSSFSGPVLLNIFGLLHENKLTCSNAVNQELAKVIALLLRDYISSWFSMISQDQDIYVELSKSISVLIQEFERRCYRIDWVNLITQDLPSIITTHIQDHRSCCKKVGTAYAGGKSFEELFYGLQGHVALENDESEREYLRRVSGILLDALLPESEIQSDAVRMIVTEIVCNNVLLNLLETFSDPDYLNELILRNIDPKFAEYYAYESNRYEGDYQSDQSEISSYAIPTESHDLMGAGENFDEESVAPDGTLFQLPKQKAKIFRRGRKGSEPAVSLFSQSLSKFTFGGFERVSSGFDKFKDYVIQTDGIPSRRKKKKKGNREFKGDTSESDFESDISPSPMGQIVPALRVEEITELEEVNPPDNNEPAPTPANPKTQVLGKPGVSFEPFPEEIMNPIPSAEEAAPKTNWWDFTWLSDLITAIWHLHRETVKGPWMLGPINTMLYERVRLEQEILELVSEIFELNHRQNWLYTQLHYFLMPIVLSFGGHVVNRAIIRSAYAVINENSLVKYLLNFRLSFWPNNEPAAPYVVRSESEKAKIKDLLEKNIIRMASNSLRPIFREEALKDRMLYLVDIFQSKRINKHLLFIFVDLVLIHLVPETANLRA